MIKLTRIDDRLLHGQVALTWIPTLGADCILVANDKIANDEFLKMTMGLAKPTGAKLLIRTIKEAIVFLNDTKYSHLKIVLLVNSVADAYAITEKVQDIQSINFGGLRVREGARSVSKAIAITEDDNMLIRQLMQRGLELEVRQVPSDNKQMMGILIRDIE